MTSEEFDALMVRLYPLLALEPRPRRLEIAMVAERLWVDQTPENQDTAAFRAHLLHLHRKGYFAFTDFVGR